MYKRAVFCFLLILMACLIAPTAYSADSKDVVVELLAKKVIMGTDGKERYSSAEKATPGEIIEYTALYKNRGSNEVKNLQGTLPVPQGMEYLPGTARPEKVNASLDGKKFAPVPLKRKVRLPNGKEEQRDVPYNEYRYIGWDLANLPAGQTMTVSARMRLLTNAEPLNIKDVKTNKK